jgi:hypothetical protein
MYHDSILPLAIGLRYNTNKIGPGTLTIRPDDARPVPRPGFHNPFANYSYSARDEI